MNLHGIVAPIIAAVNPMLAVQLLRATGYTVNPDGTQTPTQPAILPVQAQVQAMTAAELKQVSGLNLQGEMLAMYVNGTLLGEIRPDGLGGDLAVLPDGSTWLVVHVLENWSRSSGWTKVAIVRQDDTSITRIPDNV